MLLGGEIVRFTRIEELSAVSGPDAEAFRKSQQKSAAILPLQAAGRVIGALAFGARAAERQWPDLLVQRLHVLADVFANTLARHQGERALRQALEDVTRLTHQLGAENVYLRAATQAQPSDIVGTSSGLKPVLAQVERVAATDAAVLLLGETGTGSDHSRTVCS